jgi:hypothetical protein
MQQTVSKIQQELAQFKDVRDYMQCQIPDSSDDMFHKITEAFGLEDVEHLEYHEKLVGEASVPNKPKKLPEEQREANLHKAFTKILNA